MSELTAGDRLRQLRVAAGLNQKQLAMKSGVGQSSISDFENNKKSMSAEFLASIAKVLKTSSEYIIFGGSNATLTNKDVSGWEDGDEVPDQVVAIEFYRDVYASAGNGYLNGQVEQPQYIWFRIDSLQENNVNPSAAKVVTVRGDSMSPELTDGQAISVDTSATRIYDGEIYAFLVGDDMKVKILFNWNDEGMGGFKAVSRNEDKVRYPDEYYSPERIKNENVSIYGQFWWKSQTKKIRR